MDDVPDQASDSQGQAHPCAHCGTPDKVGAHICPHCGSVVAAKSWPPAPKGSDPLVIVDPERSRREVNEGFSLGCNGFLGAWVLVAIFCYWLVTKLSVVSGSVIGAAAGDFAPVCLAVALYFLMRREQPNRARGLGYAIVIAVVLALGALAICSQSHWT